MCAETTGVVREERFGSALTNELALALAALAGEPADAPPPGRPTPTPALFASVWLDAPDGTEVPVAATPITIGRVASAAIPDLAVDDPTVSRRQVRVWRAGLATLCCDLGSRNGTVRRRDDELHPVSTHDRGPTLLLPGDELITASGTLLAVVREELEVAGAGRHSS